MDGTGKSPLNMAEKLTFKKLARQRRAIHGNKRLLDSLTRIVNLSGNHFFTSPSFTGNHYTAMAVRNGFQGIQKPIEKLRRPNKIRHTGPITRRNTTAV